MSYLPTLLVAIVGGVIMSFIHAPLPWTLGPITAVSLCSLLLRRRFRWPLGVRNTALILLGYAMGRPFNAETGHAILTQLPIMLTATVITVAAGVLTACLMVRHTEINFTSCLLGCVPGGLSQMGITALVVGADISTMTAYQLTRLLFIMLAFPCIAKWIVRRSRHAARVEEQPLL